MSPRAPTLLVALTLDDRLKAAGPDQFGQIAAQIDGAAADMLIVGAGGPGLDSLVLAGWLAPRMRHTGLVVATPALHALPFHLARALSALDFMTSGRAGWLPTTLGHAEQAAAIGPGALVDEDEVCPKALDFIKATRSLWDSWDADALIINKESGVYLDSDRVRRVDYRGRYFQVMGPLNAARPPQGHPILVQDDADPLWRLTAGSSDVVLVDSLDPDVIAKRRAHIEAAGGWARLVVRAEARDRRSAPGLIDRLERLFADGAIDGVCAGVSDQARLDVITTDLMPELRRRGMTASAPVSDSLRPRLGLETPSAGAWRRA